MNRAAAGKTCGVCCAGQTQFRRESVRQDEADCPRNQIGTLDVLRPDRATTQTIDALAVVRARRLLRVFTRCIEVFGGMRFRLAAASVIVS